MTEQSMEALALGNRVRREKAAIRRDLRGASFTEGLRRAADLLERPSPPVLPMRVSYLLESIPRVGPQKVSQILSEAGIQLPVAQWRVRNMTVRQREYLAQVLREKAER